MYQWQCQYCGEEFTTEIYNKRYCSRSHQQRAYELRRAKRAQDAEIL